MRLWLFTFHGEGILRSITVTIRGYLLDRKVWFHFTNRPNSTPYQNRTGIYTWKECRPQPLDERSIERMTRIELATSYLEGKRSTNWATYAFRLLYKGGDTFSYILRLGGRVCFTWEAFLVYVQLFLLIFVASVGIEPNVPLLADAYETSELDLCSNSQYAIPDGFEPPFH